MLRKLRLALYGLALALATPALATPAGALEPALLTGEMAALEVGEPYVPAITAFTGPDGSPGDLSDYAGKVVVLNFWATWCGPCREEMPSLQALQDELGGEDFAVVTMAFGRHNPAAMQKFWDATGVRDLPLNLDGRSELARGLGVRGLPHTLLLNREGKVVAQLVGAADWAAPETLAVLRALIDA